MVYTPVGWANDETHPLSQANMKTLDGGIADAHDRVETEVLRFIASGGGGVNQETFLISPAALSEHQWRYLYFRFTGRFNQADYLRVRYNDDNTAGLHSRGLVVTQADGTVGDDEFASADTFWWLCQWGSGIGQEAWLEMHFAETTTQHGFGGGGTRIGATAATMRRSESWGRLEEARGPLTSLRVSRGPIASTRFAANVQWTIMGIPA